MQVTCVCSGGLLGGFDGLVDGAKVAQFIADTDEETQGYHSQHRPDERRRNRQETELCVVARPHKPPSASAVTTSTDPTVRAHGNCCFREFVSTAIEATETLRTCSSGILDFDSFGKGRTVQTRRHNQPTKRWRENSQRTPKEPSENSQRTLRDQQEHAFLEKRLLRVSLPCSTATAMPDVLFEGESSGGNPGSDQNAAGRRITGAFCIKSGEMMYGGRVLHGRSVIPQQ